MLKCPLCHVKHDNGSDHLKHIRKFHISELCSTDYQCHSCQKTLKWEGYRRHGHVVDYAEPSSSYVAATKRDDTDLNFDPLVQRCLDKWNEIKGKSNSTSAFADDTFDFGKEIATMFCQMMVAKYDPLDNKGYADRLTDKFDKVKTAYKRNKFVTASPSFVRPTPYTITKRFEARISRNNVILKQPDNDLAYVKPRQSLETFLKKESVAAVLSMPSDYATSSEINHVFASRRCKQLLQEIGKDFIAIQIYSDDFGSTNPLGHSAATCKINAFYLRVLNLPPALLSMEEFIILLSLAYTNDIKRCFQRMINERMVPDFQELFDNGIDLLIGGVLKNLPVVIFNIVGDNLGVHQLFGFLQSFNNLNPCRLCKVSNQTLKTITSLTECVKKTEEDYDILIRLGNFEQLKQNGIREKCSFNNLTYFHIYRAQSLDLMHDVLEGCAKYLMLNVLKTMNIDELNDAWSLFPFKRSDKTNSSMSFTEGQLQKDQLTGLTSSMMLTLIRFLPLVVHESGVEINTRTPWWSIFMDFVNIMDILMSQSFSTAKIDNLRTRVEAYLKRYQEAGGHMTVKSHFFLHDADVIEEMGPLRWNWCMRYEAAHRQFIQYASINRSHQNVVMTYGQKHQHSKMNLYTALDDPNYLQDLMKQREVKRFYPGSFVVLRLQENVPVFGCIMKYDTTVDMFEINIYSTQSFNNQRHCYAVEFTDETTILPSSLFFVPEVMELYNDKYIRLPYNIF